MSSVFFWLFVLIVFGAAGAVGFWAYRVYVLGESSFTIGNILFRPRRDPRLSISEQATLDSRRRLVLIRRDDVEHLIMTGGPVDVVIETGIAAEPRPSLASERSQAAASGLSPPVFSRPPRSFGQAVNE
jgi:hypothetical protein